MELVSLVWGCELKGVTQTGVARSGLGQPRMRLWIERLCSFCQIDQSWVSLVWGCELKDLTSVRFFHFSNGQPRMRLWIERSKKQKTKTIKKVSLVWGCELKDINGTINTTKTRSASYEAVNWKTTSRRCFYLPNPVSLVWGCELKGWWEAYLDWAEKGQPRMRLWIERSEMERLGYSSNWSASYEAVNWKIFTCFEAFQGVGQPRMRLWIERSKLLPSIHLMMVSLVWGCELKDLLKFALMPYHRSASYEAVNWKLSDIQAIGHITGQPRMRLWIER